MRKKILQYGKDDTLTPPAYPFVGPELFNRLRMALAAAFGKEQPFPRLAKLTGQPRSTTQHWFQTFEHPHVTFFLCLLEQLPERKRTELMATICRELPLLSNLRLAHDPLAVGSLENLLRQKNGLTVIRGSSEFHRTFVATALCHAAARSFGEELSVAGLDVHQPKRFVPAHGVIYFKEPLSSGRLQRLISEAWPGIASSSADLLVFNGVWSLTANLRGAVAQLAEKRHVIIADASPPDAAELARITKVTATVINLSQARENPDWIRVNIAIL